jgi:hypothetical protein
MQIRVVITLFDVAMFVACTLAFLRGLTLKPEERTFGEGTQWEKQLLDQSHAFISIFACFGFLLVGLILFGILAANDPTHTTIFVPWIDFATGVDIAIFSAGIIAFAVGVLSRCPFVTR